MSALRQFALVCDYSVRAQILLQDRLSCHGRSAHRYEWARSGTDHSGRNLTPEHSTTRPFRRSRENRGRPLPKLRGRSQTSGPNEWPGHGRVQHLWSRDPRRIRIAAGGIYRMNWQRAGDTEHDCPSQRHVSVQWNSLLSKPNARTPSRKGWRGIFAKRRHWYADFVSEEDFEYVMGYCSDALRFF